MSTHGGGMDRDETPAYLARYQQRQAAATQPDGDGHGGDTPLYLRRFRERRDGQGPAPQTPLWRRAGLELQQTLSSDNRNKEISAPPLARTHLANDVYLIRHGETQGYSTESGLTPAGAWQAHTWGRTLATRVSDGERIVFVHAATSRAGETAIQAHKGLLEGLAQFEKDVDVVAPSPRPQFRNFQVATPEGLRDVTGAFRQYHQQLEAFERTALGDRPRWLVEVDRFWRTQQGGGDPIQHWLTVPLLHFEPPALCVRRFWAGIDQLAAAHPGARLAIATHSGPIRAFAVSALGYDPGEPYNTEHVRVKLFEGTREALVTYRNRVQEVLVPDMAALPGWQLDESWDPAGLRDLPRPTAIGGG